MLGILDLEQDAGAVHRRRNGSRRIREDRHLLVERLDERHAEALVLARAQKEVGTFVKRNQLFVRHVADEMDVRDAERRNQLVQRREIVLEPALRADQQQPRSRVEDRLIRIEEAD